MKYKNELIELIPMLKGYLKKLIMKYDDLLDVDDVFQECLLNIIEKVSTKEIDNPTNYFIGVFSNTVKALSREKINEKKMKSDFSQNKTYCKQEDSIIRQIDLEVDMLKSKTQEIWGRLKLYKGDKMKVCLKTGLSYNTVIYHKNKIKRVYEKIANF